MTYILAIDQGTTSSRAILFDGALRPVAQAQEEFRQHYPSSGWVEHDPDDLWSSVAATARAAMAKAGVDWQAIAAIGITNQRETTLLWDRATGRPLHNAIVWQDRRTADACAALKEAGHEAMISARTGLLLDPYFSGTKLKWLLDTVPGARARAIRGELAFGTVDSWLIWNLTGGRVHATDATNAARTLLFNIATNAWDADICALLDIPMSLLPEVRDCADDSRRDGPRPVRRRNPDPRGRRRPAGGNRRAGVLCAGYDEIDLWDRCFALLNTGADMVPSKTGFYDNRLSLERADNVCA